MMKKIISTTALIRKYQSAGLNLKLYVVINNRFRQPLLFRRALRKIQV